LSACTSTLHPQLPQQWRATYLMAPFTIGQLVLGEIVHDASLAATRITLYGAKRGSADFLVTRDKTYELVSEGTNLTECRELGDTGWRSLPRDWLSAQSQCTGSAAILDTAVDWWKTPVDPAPSSYWLWYERPDSTPFRVVFESPNDRLAPFSRFALSHQVGFEPIERTDLAKIEAFCRQAKPSAAGHGGGALAERIAAMARATDRADAAIQRLMPALRSNCAAPSQPLWAEKLAITGLLTPFDANEDPAPVEVLYDWKLPGQRSRLFLPRGTGAIAQDALLRGEGGYTVTYRRDGAPVCVAGLPGTIRPDWASRAPCECAALIEAGTPLTPCNAARILACPLAAPRVAWAWYTLPGRPAVFMVTSVRGDEGSGSFALLDYRRWTPHRRVPRSAFDKPRQCRAPPAGSPAAAPSLCATCHFAAPRH